MAAYAALVSLMNDLDLIPNHPTHCFSFDHKQITSLSETVNFLIDFMESYDSDGCTREAAQLLESRIASAAHAAHDVIESHLVGQLLAGTTLDGKSRSYFLLDLQRAIDTLDFVKRKAICFKVKSGVSVATYSARASSEPLTSVKNVTVGFDAVVLRLLEMLTGDPSCQQVIGMGGLGKTTLARNVFDHSFIQHHFDVRLWATISHDFNVESILNELLSKNSRNVSELGLELHQKLWFRRYLIVLDDMWSDGAWDEIQRFLPDNENGSRVIVTTRLSNLASHLSSFPFEMDFLDHGQSWELFCGKTFGEEDCPIELREIAEKIVNRCRGLPLSIVVIGGHLKRSSRATEYWEMVANSMNLISGLGADDQCMKIISLSYEHLPACLKPCFLYLGIFQEDGWIDASQLLRFWIAEGFIREKKGVSLEEIAEDYLKDLSDRNLIIVCERSWNCNILKFVIHDIMREVCLKVAQQERFLGVLCTTDVIGSGRECRDFWSALIFQQVNLRSLNFNLHSGSLSYLYHILSSLSLFWNIQKLIINNEISVPYEIWEMTQLRHLEFVANPLPGVINDQSPNHEKCNVLVNLHSLLQVRNLRLTEEACRRMPNIKNMSLSYYNLSGDGKTSSSDYCPQNFNHLNKLESLDCCFGHAYKWREFVLSLVLPSSLQELTLWNCHWEDLTKIMKSLPCLGWLELHGIRGPEWELTEEEFPRLHALKICECDDLINWKANSSHFPVLEILSIREAFQLSEIPFDIGEIPTLGSIDLYECSVSAAVSAMRIVVEQESLGNEDLLLKVHFLKREEVYRFQTMVQDECLTTNSLEISHPY